MDLTWYEHVMIIWLLINMLAIAYALALHK